MGWVKKKSLGLIWNFGLVGLLTGTTQIDVTTQLNSVDRQKKKKINNNNNNDQIITFFHFLFYQNHDYFNN